jgi:membrane protease YdiL (CAAX protease family)
MSSPAQAAPTEPTTNAGSQSATAKVDNKTRVTDSLLLLAIALSQPFLGCVYYAIYGGAQNGGPAAMRYASMLVHEFIALAALAWILKRQGRNFRNIGCAWSLVDIWSSMWICVAAVLASFTGYCFLQLISKVVLGHYLQLQRVDYFSGGALLGAIVLTVVNPWFEELIVRGFVMTETTALTAKPWVAIVFSTVLQASYHLYQGWVNAVRVGLIFLVFSLFFAKRGRILPLVLAHFYIDAYALARYVQP